MNTMLGQSASQPFVSVIVPAYNAAQHIRATLESILTQTFKNFEIIVINDGSPDTGEFERVIEPFRDHIVYLKQENRGPSGARNAGIAQARGEYLALIDSDDEWYPEYLAAQVTLLREDPSLDLVYSDVLFYSDADPVGRPYMETCPSEGLVTFESLLIEKCAIPTSNAVLRRQAALDAGLFDESLRRAEDYDLWLRMAYRGAKMQYQTRVLGRHRVHSQSLSADNIKMLQSLLQVLTKIAHILTLSENRRSLLEKKRAEVEAFSELEKGKAQLRAGDFGSAAASLRKANRFLQSTKLRWTLFGIRFAPRLTSFSVRVWQSLSRRRAPKPSTSGFSGRTGKKRTRISTSL
jgi:cellulose synthase/poly-beta-1,6-N-acetylglucosamine synthase-like glycosyltransferase